MRLPALTRPLAALLTVLLLAACTGGSDEDTAETTVTPVGDSAEEALADSAERFAAAGPVRLRFELSSRAHGLSSETSGESGLSGQDVEYVSATFGLSAGTEEQEAEMVFLPPDLYMNLPDEGWYVLSPWNQGVRPDEVPDFSFDEPFLDYAALVEDLRFVEKLPDEELDGEAHEAFEATADLADLPVLAGTEARGDVDVTVWLAKDSDLPRKVELLSRPAVGARMEATFEFLDYGTAPSLPERPAEARPWRDLVFPDASCIGDGFEGCLAAQSAIQPSADASCTGGGRRVCLAPLGQISPDLVAHLVEHYHREYGLEVSVLAPASVPAGMADPLRQQIDAVALIEYMGTLFPEAYGDSEAVLIGLTPLDLYNSTSHFRYVFGLKGDYSDPKAVVSSMRMTPVFYGEPADQELFFSRMRKLVSKYVGLLYYGLPPSDDPKSPMFDSILGPADLDTMTEPLPVE